MANSIRTCLWFGDGRGREAAQFYCSLIPDSRVERVFMLDEKNGSALIDFTLGGVPYQILDAGQESHCGWLKDRFGVSWQIFPRRLTELTLSSDKRVSAPAMAEMMKQMKIDIAAIEAAVKAAASQADQQRSK